MTPMVLPTPAAAWRRRTGVVVIGSGAAGLAATVHLAAARVPTLLLTRAGLTDAATDWAQGGLAAVWADDDTAAAHVDDTLTAGAGLCEPDAVRTLVEEAPASIHRLIALGAEFDRDASGAYDLHLEGGHSARRILHAGGDASGHEVELTLAAALTAAVRATDSTVEALENQRAVDILMADGQACGVRVRQPDGVIGEVYADAVVLASGGVGQLWPLTTNPAVATGDGLAMAYRAGAMLRDVEFVQFHPTVLWIDPSERVPGDRGVLISEAVRGEGAILIDHRGERVMAGKHPLADLAPRDVVSATMEAHLVATGRTHLFLDARHFGRAMWEEKFPSILALCRERGIDPITEPIPVHPGAHYHCGGVAAAMDGRTTVPGLFAVGEVAATGVQGANRLASNSVTEALVTGDRLGALLAAELPRTPVGRAQAGTAELLPASTTAELQAVMGRHVEVARDEEGLARALRTIVEVPSTHFVRSGIVGEGVRSGIVGEGVRSGIVEGDPTLVERAERVETSPAQGVSDGVELTDATLDATNLHTVARLITTAALARTESRGCHRRADYSDRDPQWAQHLCLEAGPAGEIVVTRRPLGEHPDHLFAAPNPHLQEAPA